MKQTVLPWRAVGGMPLACLLVCICAAGLPAQDDLLPERGGSELTMRFDFSARAASDAAFAANLTPLELPDWSRSFLCIRSAVGARPLFITGNGRRGRLTFSFRRDAIAARGGYAVGCDGNFTAELADYQVSPGVNTADMAGAGWLPERAKWRVTVTRIHSAAARDEGDALHAFLERRDVPMQTRKGERAHPEAFLRVKVDLELRSPTGLIPLHDREAEIRLSVVECVRWGRRHPYWTVSISTTLQVDAQQLGLVTTRGDVLTVTAVLGAVAWVPGTVRHEEIPDVTGESADVESADGMPEF